MDLTLPDQLPRLLPRLFCEQRRGDKVRMARKEAA